MPTLMDIFSRPITSTADQVMRQAKRPMLGGPGMTDENIGEVGSNPYAGEVGPQTPPMPSRSMQLPPPAPLSPQMPPQDAVPGASPAAPAAPAVSSPPQADGRSMLKAYAMALLGSRSPAERVQGMQMLFEAQQPLPSEKADAERSRLAAAVDSAPAEEEAKAQARTLVELGASPKEISETLGFGREGKRQTKGQMAVDAAFAPKYVEFKTGGAANAEKSIAQLEDAQTALQNNAHTFGVTGAVGYLPDSIAATFPAGRRSISVREAVEGVIQNSMKDILGSQFTQKEGERLIARAYNPKLSPDENAQRLSRLVSQLQTAYRDKSEAMKYFDEHDTLKGYTGRLNPSMSDFERSLDEPAGKGDKALTPKPTRPPGADDAALINQARAAVAKGADPAKVRQRLIEMGVGQ